MGGFSYLKQSSQRLDPQRAEGAGDGSTRVFDLGHASAILHLVYVGGVIQPTSIYSLLSGTGAGGVDQVQFGVGSEPPDGEPVDIAYFVLV